MFATDDMFNLKSGVSVFFSDQAILTNEIGAARNKLPRFGTDAVTHPARSHARGLLPNASNAQAACNGQVLTFRRTTIHTLFHAPTNRQRVPAPFLTGGRK